MPGYDRTGPMGAGPMTGGGGGRCGARSAAGDAEFGFGRGSGRGGGRRCGGGRGRGFRGRGLGLGPRAWDAGRALDIQPDRSALQAQARSLRDSLQAVERRLEELEQ